MPVSARRTHFVIATAVALAVAVGALRLSGAAATGDQPPFLFPWQDGQEWRTGIAGFHTVRDALDFFPPDTPLGMDVVCEGDPGWYPAVSQYVVLASAAGIVVQAGDNQVIID